MSDAPSSSLARLLARAAVFALLAATLWIGGRQVQAEINPTRIGTDDANIYFCYARNLSQGLGCVWTPGGERVEGCTSALWTAVCTAVFRATSAPESAAFVVSVLLAALAAWVVAMQVARLVDGVGDAAATLAGGGAIAVWIATSPSHVIWMTATLMDTALWTAAIVVTWLAASAWSRHPESRARAIGLGAASVVLMTARPEGPLVGFALIAASVPFAARSSGGFAAALRRAAVPLGMLTIATVALFVGRRIYFGVWLPNTYYAKVDADPWFRLSIGAPYLGRFAAAFPWACAAFVAAALGAFRRPRPPEVVLALVAVALGIVNVLYVGGDHFEGWRVLQPYWILMPLPIVAAVRRWLARRPRSGAAAALAAVAAIAVVTLFTSPLRWGRLSEHSGIRVSFYIAECGRLVAQGFNTIFPPEERPVVGVVAAGGFPLVYGGRSVDLLGLNNPEMARATRRRRSIMFGHGAFHAPTLFKAPPEILIGFMRTFPAVEVRPALERVPFAELDATETRRFDEIYAPAAVVWTEGSAPAVAMPVWARRDWLARVRGRYPLREIE